MKPLTQEWSQKAEGDYTVVATLWQAESTVYDAICFHAQQCIEKLPQSLVSGTREPLPEDP